MQRNDEIQTDLRAFLAAVEEGGEVKHVAGAHWDRELGAVTEVLYREKVDKSPLLLFDEVPGYASGMRCLYGMLGSPSEARARPRHRPGTVRRPAHHARHLPPPHQEPRADPAPHRR